MAVVHEPMPRCPTFGDPHARIRKVFARSGLDARRGADRQKHLRVAGAAQPLAWPPHRPPRRNSRRGAGSAGPSRHQFSLAHRRVGAQPRLENHQAALRQPAMPSPRPIRSSTTASPTIWAASRPTSTSATAAITTAFAWPATWCPTTWASIRPGSSSIPSGSSRAGIRPIPPTASMAPISPTTAASRSKSKTTTTSSPMPPWSSGAATRPPAKRATSITATTAPAFPGTTRRSSTT